MGGVEECRSVGGQEWSHDAVRGHPVVPHPRTRLQHARLLHPGSAPPQLSVPCLKCELIEADIWSVGCIFAELISRRQLFPGKDHVSQLKLIVSFLGTPSDDIMDRISSDIVKTLITSMGACEPLPWANILPKAGTAALDLIDRMMQIAPWQRSPLPAQSTKSWR